MTFADEALPAAFANNDSDPFTHRANKDSCDLRHFTEQVSLAERVNGMSFFVLFLAAFSLIT